VLAQESLCNTGRSGDANSAARRRGEEEIECPLPVVRPADKQRRATAGG